MSCTIINSRQGLNLAGRASKTGELKAVGSLVHSRQPRGIQRPNPSALSDFSKNGVLLTASIDYHDR